LHDHLAQSLKGQGDAAMTERRFDDALAAYEKAAGIEPSAVLDYNRARALQALGHRLEALELLEKFESEADAELKARVPQLDALLNTLRSGIGSLDVSGTAPGATLRVGRRPSLPLPLSRPLRLEPGPVEIRIEADGYVPETRLVEVRAGEPLRIAVRLRSIDPLATHRVDSNVRGAELAIDAKLAGQVPIEVLLEPGVHALRLYHGGYEPHQSRIVTRAKEQRDLRIQLEPTPPLYAQWWFWAGIGLVAATTTVTLVALHTDASADSGDIPPGRLGAPLLRF
jgi:tetratricopeptide (TPR) repeat protein